MIGIMKKPLRTKSKTRNFVFENFALYEGKKNSLCAVEGKNCDCKDGVLKTGIGGKIFVKENLMTVPAPTEESMQNVYLLTGALLDGSLQEETLVGISESGYLYYYDYMEEVWKKKCNAGKGARVVRVVGTDGTVKFLSVGWGFAWVHSADFSTREQISSLAFRSVCLQSERVFFVDGYNGLRYSSPTAPWDFSSTIDDGGILRFSSDWGGTADLIALGDSVYLLLQRGIVRVKTAGRARDFVIEKIPYVGSKILIGSALVLNGKIVFMTVDGLRMLDGNKVVEVGKHLPIKAKFSSLGDCSCATADGKAIWQYTDENGEKKLLVLDGNFENGYFADTVDGLGGSEGRALFCKDGQVCEMSADGDLSVGTEYFFKTGKIDFGLRGRKRLKKISFEGEGSFRLGIESENGYKEQEVCFVDGEATVKTESRGWNFVFTIKPNKGCILRKASVEFVTQA